jgi:hypothetical protein
MSIKMSRKNILVKNKVEAEGKVDESSFYITAFPLTARSPKRNGESATYPLPAGERGKVGGKLMFDIEI